MYLESNIGDKGINILVDTWSEILIINEEIIEEKQNIIKLKKSVLVGTNKKKLYEVN